MNDDATFTIIRSERRSVPRTTPFSCPHCFGRMTAAHARDSGDLTPAEAVRLGYCPVLAAKRTTSNLPQKGSLK